MYVDYVIIQNKVFLVADGKVFEKQTIEWADVALHWVKIHGFLNLEAKMKAPKKEEVKEEKKVAKKVAKKEVKKEEVIKE